MEYHTITFEFLGEDTKERLRELNWQCMSDNNLKYYQRCDKATLNATINYLMMYYRDDYAIEEYI